MNGYFALKSLHKVLNIPKFNLEADMFASNINHQFHNYVSYKADPKELKLWTHSQSSGSP